MEGTNNTFSRIASKPLREWEQKLVSKKFDNEVGFTDSALLKFVTWQKPQAVSEYFQSLAALQQQVTVSKTSSCPQLWDGISTRIKQEAYNDLLLGKRRNVASEGMLSYLSSFIPQQILSPRFAGSVAVACVGLSLSTYFVTNTASRPNDIRLTSGSQQVAKYIPPQIIPDVQSVALDNASYSDRGLYSDRNGMVPTISRNGYLSSRIPQAVSIDWLRSKGSVRLVDRPKDKVAVLWVSPRSARDTSSSSLRQTGVSRLHR